MRRLTILLTSLLYSVSTIAGQGIAIKSPPTLADTATHKSLAAGIEDQRSAWSAV